MAFSFGLLMVTKIAFVTMSRKAVRFGLCFGARHAERSDIVVIGAGIMGLAIRLPPREPWCGEGLRRRPPAISAAGASGRNGGGVRAQWSSEANVRLMQESIRICRDFASEMKINVWFRQGGIPLHRAPPKRSARARGERERAECMQIEHAHADAEEAQEIVPELDTNGIVAASYNGDDGRGVFRGRSCGASRGGAEARRGDPHVHGRHRLEMERGEITGVVLDRVGKRGTKGVMKTRKVVNAAGAWSPEIARCSRWSCPTNRTATRSARRSR